MFSKEQIIKYIVALPNIINAVLIRLNHYPRLVYGSSYIARRDQANIHSQNVQKIDRDLLNVCRQALKNVPYYRRLYANTEVSDRQAFSKTWSLIDKEIVMANPSDFISDEIDRTQFVEGTTGGTSGKPMWMLQPKNRHTVELGAVHSHWNQFGFNNQPRAVLRNAQPNKPYAINPITREYIFNGFQLNDATFELIYQTMQKQGIKYLHCYPSAGFEFCRYMKRHKLERGSIQALFASSEMVYDYHVSAAQELGLQYATHYGHSEKLVFAHNCPYSEHYHILEQYGLLELVTDAGEVITEEGVVGEIVGTTLTNNGFPLIRYKTGDKSEYIKTECECGFNGLSLKRIYGRWDGSKIFNLDDTYVTPTALNLHSDLYDVIAGLQYVQSQRGKLNIRLVPEPEFTDEHLTKFQNYFESCFNPDADIRVELVDELERHSNGKFQLLISDIQLEA